MIPPLPKEIATFIKKHHVLSLSVLYQGEAWAANCFYVFDSKLFGFIIVTDINTRHGSAFLQNNQISGTISNNQKQILRIKGVQFQGVVRELKGDEMNYARHQFLRKFPFATLGTITLWLIELYMIKMTDNSIVFSHKCQWNR
jgi:uncharacterized protein YhbP (UPF0306 family)